MNGIKKIHLLISVFFIIPIGLTYGLYPKIILSELFDFTVSTTDLSNVFRALMGLYLGMAGFWIAGIVKPKFWKVATITNVIFMGGLALGRLLSLFLDGIPSIYFSIGLIIEILLALWGIVNLKKYQSPG